MDKTLNDTIDSLFRGIVFIIINFVTSAARMIAGPGSGCIRLVRRLYARDMEQVRPFVFLFICLFLTAAAPIFVDAVTEKDKPYEYKIYQNGALQKDAAGRQLYKSISEKIETKEMFVLLLCIIAGVTAFHICARVLRYILFPPRPRRQIAEHCLLYVVATQALLLLFLYFIDARYGFDDFYRAAPPPAREFVNLLSSA